MADVLANAIIEKLTSLVGGEIKAVKSAKKDLKLMHDTMVAICAVLEDAEVKGYTNKAIHIWLRDLKSVVYDIDDLLDEVAFYAKLRKANQSHFTRQLRYLASSSNPIVSRFNLSHKLKDLREKLVRIVAKKNDFGLIERCVDRDEIRNSLDGTPAYLSGSIVGRDKAKQEILAKIDVVRDATELSVLPIVGMGGSGKTALAKLVYADVQDFDLKLWTYVSGESKTKHILEKIVKAGSGDNMPNQETNILVTKVQRMLKDNKYFLVLDDVDVKEIAKWKEFKGLLTIGKAGSVILITTREARVGEMTTTSNMEPYDLKELPDDDCWSIFEGLAFKEGEGARYPRLYEIGRSIVEKCCGIPLAVVMLGSLLQSERNYEEWQRVSEMASFVELNQNYDNKVMRVLKISYDKLPSHLKSCFTYFSLFRKDLNLDSVSLTYMWSAHGLLGVKNEKKGIEHCGHSYFMELISRSLLQEPVRLVDKLTKCGCESKMHDLLHDLAMSIHGEELSVVTLDKLSISEFARHIVWGYDEFDSLEDKEFPEELLKARNARSFRFSYKMMHISQSFLKGIMSHFNCLRFLNLGNCWFEELPASWIKKLKHLRYLNLSYNPIIRILPDTICSLLNLEVLDLEGCVELKEIPRDVFHLQCLRFFSVTTCQRSLIDTKINLLNSLHHLDVDSCRNLESLWENGNAEGLTSLRILCISRCPKLKSLPDSMRSLVSLQALEILDCQMLDLVKAEWLRGLQSLRLLRINGIPIVANSIQYVKGSLEILQIFRCRGLKLLPDWLQDFASLCHLEIQDCPNLLGFPEGFCYPKSLQQLSIYGCPQFSKWFAKLAGRHLQNIQQVPLIVIDGVHHEQ